MSENEKVITLEIPSDSMTFNIGGNDYTVSFADKTFALFLDQYNEIKNDEFRLQQNLHHRAVELTDKEAQLENDMVNDPMSELDHKKQILQRRYLKIYDDIQNKYREQAMQRFYKLLNSMFGNDAGKKIYNTCNKSMVVFSKVVAQIMINVEQHTDIQDYRDKYFQTIKGLRDETKEEQ